MSTEPQPESPAPGAQRGGSGRPPAWLIAAQGALTLAVLAAIVVAVIVLSGQGPSVVHLGRPDATEEALNAGQPAPSPAAVLPDSNPGGPLGAIGHAAPQKGQPAPDFALQTLDGSRVQLSDLKGKVVVVNFWATWCAPCKQEFPELEKAAASANGDVVVLALDQAESAARVSQFAEQYGATFTILMDSRSEVADSYLLTGIPDTIIVDRDGLVSDVSLGPLSAGTFRYKITQALQGR